MYFLKFTIQFIVILNIAIHSVGFRYHCIGKAGKPPCFVDMIPWEDSYKKVFLKFFLKIDRDYFAHLQHKALYDRKYLYILNDLIKLLLVDGQVRLICELLHIHCKWPTYIKIHMMNKHYKKAPGNYPLFWRRKSME